MFGVRGDVSPTRCHLSRTRHDSIVRSAQLKRGEQLVQVRARHTEIARRLGDVPTRALEGYEDVAPLEQPRRPVQREAIRARVSPQELLADTARAQLRVLASDREKRSGPCK